MGVPFKVMGGAWSVPGYAMKGLYQEMVKSKGKSVQNYIIAARIAQGYDEATTISQHERDEIVSRWKFVKVGIKKKRNPGAEQMDSLHSLVEEKRKRRNERWERVNAHFKKPEGRPNFQPQLSQQSSYSSLPLTPMQSHASSASAPESRQAIPEWRQRELSLTSQRSLTDTRPVTAQSSQSRQSELSLEAQLIAEEEAERREIEAAIAASVAERSRGNPEEDELVASAIRASIAELERTPPEGASAEDDEQLLKRAMTASLEEAGRSGCTEEEQKVLEETLRKSLLDTTKKRQHGSDTEWDSDSDTEDDEEFQRIIAESKELAHLHAHHPQDYANTTPGAQQESGIMDAMGQAIQANNQSSQHNDEEDAELQKVLAESEAAEKQRMSELEKQKTEEDIVLEYVRRQSLLEEEHRLRLMQGRDTKGEGSRAGAAEAGKGKSS